MSEEIASLRAVFVDQLKGLYSTETLLAKALPKMAKAATAPGLKKAFARHAAQTRVHAERLKSVCALLEEKPTGRTCQATVGLVKEGQEAIDEDALPEMRDLRLIAAARRVEHYEMAGYNSACELARVLGLNAILKTLASTLQEETATDALLGKATSTAFTKAFAVEQSAAHAGPPGAGAEVGQAIRKVVRKITG